MKLETLCFIYLLFGLPFVSGIDFYSGSIQVMDIEIMLKVQPLNSTFEGTYLLKNMGTNEESIVLSFPGLIEPTITTQGTTISQPFTLQPGETKLILVTSILPFVLNDGSLQLDYIPHANNQVFTKKIDSITLSTTFAHSQAILTASRPSLSFSTADAFSAHYETRLQKLYPTSLSLSWLVDTARLDAYRTVAYSSDTHILNVSVRIINRGGSSLSGITLEDYFLQRLFELVPSEAGFTASTGSNDPYYLFRASLPSLESQAEHHLLYQIKITDPTLVRLDALRLYINGVFYKSIPGEQLSLTSLTPPEKSTLPPSQNVTQLIETTHSEIIGESLTNVSNNPTQIRLEDNNSLFDRGPLVHTKDLDPRSNTDNILFLIVGMIIFSFICFYLAHKFIRKRAEDLVL